MADPGMKDIRGYIRQSAARAEAFKVLDAQLGEAMDLNGLLASRKAELANIDNELGKVRSQAEADKAAIAQEVAVAREEIGKAKADAKTIKADAEQRAKTVDALVAEAKAEADRLIGRGRSVGEQLASELEGRIPKIKAELAEIETRKTQVANDVAALENRKAAVQAQINKLRESLAESA